MAQLKSTSVTGNLSVTGNIVASQIIKNNGTNNDILLGGGDTTSLTSLEASISGAQTTANNASNAAAAAQAKADSAYALADTKTTMTAVEAKNYATKTEAQGYANNVLGTSADTSDKNTVHGAKAAAAAAHTAANNADTNANSRVPKSGNTTIDGELTANKFIGPLQGYARYLETKKQDKAGGGWYGANYNFYAQWDETTNNICELKTVGGYDTRATRAFEDADGNVISSTYLKLTGGTMTGSLTIADTGLANGTSTYDKIIMASDMGLLGYRTVNQFRADLKLAQVYDYKGTLNDINALKAITSAKIGDTYFISSSGESWSCKTEVTAATGDNYQNYWSSIGNTVDLSGYVTLNTNQTITGQKTFTQQIVGNINYAEWLKPRNNSMSYTNGDWHGGILTAEKMNEGDATVTNRKIVVWKNAFSNPVFMDNRDSGDIVYWLSRNAEGNTVQLDVGIDGHFYQMLGKAVLDTDNVSGHTDCIPKFTATNTIGDSNITDNGNIINFYKPLNMNNNDLQNVNMLTFADPGQSEGIKWLSGNEWQIYESPDDLKNDKGNLQFIQGQTRRLTISTNGYIDIPSGLLKLSNAEFQYNTDDKCIDVLFN